MTVWENRQISQVYNINAISVELMRCNDFSCVTVTRTHVTQFGPASVSLRLICCWWIDCFRALLGRVVSLSRVIENAAGSPRICKVLDDWPERYRALTPR